VLKKNHNDLVECNILIHFCSKIGEEKNMIKNALPVIIWKWNPCWCWSDHWDRSTLPKL